MSTQRSSMEFYKDGKHSGSKQNAAAPRTDLAESRLLTAYSVRSTEMRLEPASVDRKWMNETEAGFANRCLPLRIANQSGWVLLNDRRIDVMWTGGSALSDLAIRVHGDHPPDQTLMVGSHFGFGILTWSVPFLFRTPPGYNLFVRGPTNHCKDGACPLDAVVETDWAVATFTMNWKITRAGMLIPFDAGEPICMVFPMARGELELFSPEIRDIADDPDLRMRHLRWAEGRQVFNEELKVQRKASWQKDYYVGREHGGDTFTDHQIKISLQPVTDLRRKK